jgi:4-alpha-glucanotransferase
MNLIGTHDTDRILTVLGRDEDDEYLSNAEKAKKKLSKRQLEHGIAMLKIASALQFTAYGIPCVYYGDEVGLEGYGDPFCRMPFPWHRIGDRHRAEILEYYKTLGRIRNEEKALNGGHFYVLKRDESSIVFVREKDGERIFVCANRGSDFVLDIPDGMTYKDLTDNNEYNGCVTVKSDRAMILKEMKK